MTGMLACGAPVAPQRRNTESHEATPRSSNGFFTLGRVADRLPSAVRPTRMLARPARALRERQLWRSPTNPSTPAPRALASTAARPLRAPCIWRRQRLPLPKHARSCVLRLRFPESTAPLNIVCRTRMHGERALFAASLRRCLLS